MSGNSPGMRDVAQANWVEGPTTAAWLRAWVRNGRWRNVALRTPEALSGLGRIPRQQLDRQEFANVARTAWRSRSAAPRSPVLPGPDGQKAGSGDFAFVALPCCLGMPMAGVGRWFSPRNPVDPGGGERGIGEFVLLRGTARGRTSLPIGRSARMAVVGRGPARLTWQMRALPAAGCAPRSNECGGTRAGRRRGPDRH
jgi:hypothetical protein